ncbi:MAG: AMP-binding protein [Eubacteriales bacterium]|nr:AMP-binding protein [Eubacteriales bacterium]
MRKTRLDNWICEIESLPELTREGLDALQLRRLNETLARLKIRGGIYAGCPEKLEDLSQLAELPFTTPAMLAKNPGAFLLTSQAEVSRVISGATSGTTGPAKRVFYTQRDTENTIGFFAAGIGEMLSPGEKCLIAFPFSGPFGLGDLIAKAVERLGGIPIRAGFGQNWGELSALVEETQPETYIGFPVTLLSLSRMYGKPLPIRRALVSGDACPKGVIEALEACLRSKLYPHYGSRECGLGGAVTCPAHEGMHLRENHIIPEIIGENGQVLPEGEYGELVITTIGLEAMPLLRYRTGDYTRILPPCPCGGVTRRIDTVSRMEGAISIETLDSALFPLEALVDYHACFDGTLHLDARTVDGSGGDWLTQAAQDGCPGISVKVQVSQALLSQRPMYLGKRFLETE